MDEQRQVTMTHQELEEIIETAITRALDRVGVDVENPRESRRDFEFVRDWRRSTESVKGKALLVAIGIVVSGMIGAMWLGIKSLVLR